LGLIRAARESQIVYGNGDKIFLFFPDFARRYGRFLLTKSAPPAF
jgi:hypothetical protein